MVIWIVFCDEQMIEAFKNHKDAEAFCENYKGSCIKRYEIGK